MSGFDKMMADSTAKAFKSDRDPIYCIFTKPRHVEKIANIINAIGLRCFITSEKHEIKSFAYPFDVGVSYCCPYVLDIDDRPFYNYHPALLPKYKGVNIYADAIRNAERMWGVTLHRMTDKVDEGEIIQSIKFPIDAPLSTDELGTIAHGYLIKLFRSTIWTLK